MNEEQVLTPKKREQINRRLRRANNLIKLAPELVKSRKCKAFIKAKNKQCGRWAIKGGTVCVKHGGSAPQVKKSAALRLLAMVDPALVQLQELVLQNVHLPSKLGAIRTVLERAGDDAIGPLKKQIEEKDTRPIINIGIKVGGIAKPQGTLIESDVVEGEVVEE